MSSPHLFTDVATSVDSLGTKVPLQCLLLPLRHLGTELKNYIRQFWPLSSWQDC